MNYSRYFKFNQNCYLCYVQKNGPQLVKQDLNNFLCKTMNYIFNQKNGSNKYYCKLQS
jgi:hypothetical protein